MVRGVSEKLLKKKGLTSWFISHKSPKNLCVNIGVNFVERQTSNVHENLCNNLIHCYNLHSLIFYIIHALKQSLHLLLNDIHTNFCIVNQLTFIFPDDGYVKNLISWMRNCLPHLFSTCIIIYIFFFLTYNLFQLCERDVLPTLRETLV